MADEQLRQEKQGKAKPVKEMKKPVVASKEVKKAEDNIKHKQVENKKEENKTEATEEKKPIIKKEIKKENKHKAEVNGRSLPISLKHSKGIGKFIKNKSIEKSIDDLELVIKKKIAVPMIGELPHRKGMMSGKYPFKASKEFIILLKSLKGNVIMNGLELEKTRISEVIINKAPDQMHRFGRMKFKRTHVTIKCSDVGIKKNMKDYQKQKEFKK